VRASSRLAVVAVIVAAERVCVCVCLRSCYVVASVFGCLYMHVGESAHKFRGFRLVSSLKGLTGCPFRALRVSSGGVLASLHFTASVTPQCLVGRWPISSGVTHVTSLAGCPPHSTDLSHCLEQLLDFLPAEGRGKKTEISTNFSRLALKIACSLVCKLSQAISMYVYAMYTCYTHLGRADEGVLPEVVHGVLEELLAEVLSLLSLLAFLVQKYKY
jgi:hypothetical protein